MLEASFFSDVISFHLEQVIIPSWLCSEVVVWVACVWSTPSMCSVTGLFVWAGLLWTVFARKR